MFNLVKYVEDNNLTNDMFNTEISLINEENKNFYLEYCDEIEDKNIELDVSQFVEIKSVDHHGGEGRGDDYYTIFKVVELDKSETYWKFDGWYTSFYGAEFERCYQVEPKKVIKIDWVSV